MWSRIALGLVVVTLVVWAAWPDIRFRGGASASRTTPPQWGAGTDVGNRTMRGVVGAREVDVWTLRFATPETARIWVEGEDRSRLDCVAQDAAGNLLDVDADTAGRCELVWVPKRTGGYRIMIRNAGSTSTRYQLVAR